MVWGEGRGPLAIVADKPGSDEDLLGKPFTGVQGQYLDKLLGKVGLSRKQTFLTYALKCHPGFHRVKRSLYKVCKDWLLEELNGDFHVIVTLGVEATQSLLGLKLKDIAFKAQVLEGYPPIIPWYSLDWVLGRGPAEEADTLKILELAKSFLP